MRAPIASNIHGKHLFTIPFALVAALVLTVVVLLAGCQQEKPAEEAEKTAEPVERMEVADVEEPSLGAEYVLIVGDDSWENYTPGRADLMILMRVDFDADQITLVTVPRDTQYTWDDGGTIKANMAYELGGIDAQLKAVRTITGIDVENYVVVGFDGLQSIVEAFGGLDANLPYALTYSFYTKDFPDEHYEAGEQTLTPWRSMALSRARTGYDEYGLSQDMMRQTVNRQLMGNLIADAFQDPAQAAEILATLLPSVTTNIPAETITEWAADLASADAITVYGTSGPVDGGILEEFGGAWLIPYDEGKWSALMDVVDAGGDPATVDAQFEENVQPDIAPINTKRVIDLG